MIATIAEAVMEDVTQLLARVREQDNEALNRLFSIVYDDLHRMAQAKVAHNGPMTLLDPTSLVHEAYLRFQRAGRLDLDSRGRFMAYAAQVLRTIIVDMARRRSADRRGGGAVHATLNTDIAASIGQTDSDIEWIDTALDELEATDPRLKQVVEMRYFGGLTEAEVAEALGVTERTVRRDWQRARLLLSVSLRK
jgi:RNA polymerase sigma factor (TIGR02999 family)